jgi:hypothetical protein
MSSQTSQKYKFEYNPSNKIVTKTEIATGNTWHYISRPIPAKPVFKAKNGITVEAIQAAGHNVRVKHLRWAVYIPHTITARASTVAVVVPSTFRKDPNYMFTPKGGYTHVVIKKKDGEYLCVSSTCAPEDPFCYAAGVAAALDRLTLMEIASLELE